MPTAVHLRSAARVRALALAFFALAIPAVVGGCASTDGDEEEATRTVLAPWVPASDIARNLGLTLVPSSPSRVQLEGQDRRILLFPGTRTASVAGQTLELAEPVSGAGATALVAAADAALVELTWRTAPPLPPDVGAPSSTGPDLRLPPPPSRIPAGSAPAAVPVSSSNAPSAAEIAAWSVPLKRRWEYIVVHHTASAIGSAAQIDKWHKDKGWDGLGYDFVIGNGTGSGDGVVETGYRWRQQLVGAHVRVSGSTNYMNEHGIGICLVGDFDHTRPSAAQMRSLSRLTSFLAGYCSIPATSLRLHGDVKSTDCPGKLFPRDFAIRGTGSVRSAAGRPATPPSAATR